MADRSMRYPRRSPTGHFAGFWVCLFTTSGGTVRANPHAVDAKGRTDASRSEFVSSPADRMSEVHLICQLLSLLRMTVDIVRFFTTEHPEYERGAEAMLADLQDL